MNYHIIRPLPVGTQPAAQPRDTRDTKPEIRKPREFDLPPIRSRDDYEKVVQGINAERTKVIQMLLGHDHKGNPVPKIDGLLFNQLSAVFDRKEQQAANSLAGVRLRMMEQDTLRKAGAIWVIPTKRGWICKRAGQWVTVTIAQCVKLQMAGATIILLVPANQVADYQRIYEPIGFRVQVKHQKPRTEEQEDNGLLTTTPEQPNEPATKRSLQIVPLDVGRKLAEQGENVIFRPEGYPPEPPVAAVVLYN